MSALNARQNEEPQLGYRDAWFLVMQAYRHDEISLGHLNRLSKQFVGAPASSMTAFSINQALERAREEVVRERASTSQPTSPSTTGTAAGTGTSSNPMPATSSTDPQGGLPL